MTKIDDLELEVTNNLKTLNAERLQTLKITNNTKYIDDIIEKQTQRLQAIRFYKLLRQIKTPED